MENHDRLRIIAGTLLITSSITHIAQLWVYGFDSHQIGAAIFGSFYLILGILLIKYRENRMIALLGAIIPILGGTLGVWRLFQFFILATGEINFFIVFHVIVDVIVVPICICSYFTLRD